MIGPRKMPKLPVNAKKLNARAWVFCVLFSVIIVRMVLDRRYRQQTLASTKDHDESAREKQHTRSSQRIYRHSSGTATSAISFG